MNTFLLKGIMYEHQDSMEDLAQVLNINSQTLYMKMREYNGSQARRQQFNQSEIKLIVDRYDLTGDEIKRIFFN